MEIAKSVPTELRSARTCGTIARMTQSNVPIMDYEGSPWRTEFWKGRAYEDAVERIALKKTLPARGTRLVEIGAGFGRLADLYRGYEQVILLDYARSMLKDAVARLGSDARFIFVAADLYNLPFADNAFDTALTIRVLHHVADIPRAFAQVARVVHSRGTYITDFANKRHLKAIAKYYLARARGIRAVNPFSLEPYEFVKLNFDYHPSYIRQNLEQVGFHIQDSLAVSTFRLGALKRAVPNALLVSCDDALQRPTARFAIAPSILYRAENGKAGAARVNAVLWRCVKCGAAKMNARETAMQCEQCGAQFFQTDGIWEMKV
jgi:ubiquinone/menaquinone biosynthesis C-methylase UbiE